MKHTITRFVGRRLLKIAILGIVKSAANAVTGGSGIATNAIGVPMALVCHANIVASQDHFLISNKKAEPGTGVGPGKRCQF